MLYDMLKYFQKKLCGHLCLMIEVFYIQFLKRINYFSLQHTLQLAGFQLYGQCHIFLMWLRNCINYLSYCHEYYVIYLIIVHYIFILLLPSHLAICISKLSRKGLCVSSIKYVGFFWVVHEKSNMASNTGHNLSLTHLEIVN